MMLKLHGLIAAPFTPFAPDGSLRLESVSTQANSLRAQGLSGVFVGGTTGEGESLTTRERKQLAEAWLEQAREGFKVIINVGHASAAEGMELAQHAARAGADAVGAIYMHHHKPGSIDEVVTYCAKIASGAASLPFYYYHMPAQSGVPFKASDILLAASKIIPNLAGCKFTFEDLMDFQLCLELEDGRFDVLFGRDEALLASLAVGAEGWIGSTFNYAGPIYLKLISAFRSGDFTNARRHQKETHDILRVILEMGGLNAGKAASRSYGLDLGPVRPPMRALSEEELQILKMRLSKYALGPEKRAAQAQEVAAGLTAEK